MSAIFTAQLLTTIHNQRIEDILLGKDVDTDAE